MRLLAFKLLVKVIVSQIAERIKAHNDMPQLLNPLQKVWKVRPEADSTLAL